MLTTAKDTISSNYLRTANFTTEEIDFDSSATVSSANYPSNYPSEHLQETIIRSNEVVEFTITFLEPILFDRAEVLCVSSGWCHQN